MSGKIRWHHPHHTNVVTCKDVFSLGKSRKLPAAPELGTPDHNSNSWCSQHWWQRKILAVQHAGNCLKMISCYQHQIVSIVFFRRAFGTFHETIGFPGSQDWNGKTKYNSNSDSSWFCLNEFIYVPFWFWVSEAHPTSSPPFIAPLTSSNFHRARFLVGVKMLGTCLEPSLNFLCLIQIMLGMSGTSFIGSLIPPVARVLYQGAKSHTFSHLLDESAFSHQVKGQPPRTWPRFGVCFGMSATVLERLSGKITSTLLFKWCGSHRWSATLLHRIRFYCFTMIHCN